MTLNGEHGARATLVIAPKEAIVMSTDRLLARGENLVVVGHHVVGRQPAVLDRQRHRTSRGMEPHPDVGRRLDLCGQQVTGTPGMQVEMVGRGGAAGERQFGEAHPCRHVHRLGVDAAPPRIQRLQPPEQRLVGHRRERPREVLEQVMMGVDEAWRDQAVGGVEHRGCRWRGTGADRAHQPVGDRHPATVDLAPGRVERGHTASVDDHDIGSRRPRVRRLRGGGHSEPSVSRIDWMSSTVVRGLTMQNRRTVSPCHLVGTTNERPAASSPSLHA